MNSFNLKMSTMKAKKHTSVMPYPLWYEDGKDRAIDTYAFQKDGSKHKQCLGFFQLK